MSVTIRDIARICGVGVSTVSRAVNGHTDINKETRERILEAVKRYNYVPNNSARNLKKLDTRTIALLIKGIENPFFFFFLKTFEEETKNNGYSLVVQHVDEFTDEADVAEKLVQERRLNGLIFLGGCTSHVQNKLDHIEVPFVISTIGIANPEEAKRYAQVSVDDIREGKRAVDYLIDNGHGRIAILAASSLDDSVGKLRLLGYGRALKEHGIPIIPELIVSAALPENPYSYENGYKTARKLLNSGETFTAVFALSDTMAVGAAKAFLEAGKRIPEDISLIGFDGQEITRYYNPVITTLEQPTQEIARATISMLMEMILSPEQEKKQIVFEGRILEGGSVRKLEYPEKRSDG